MLNRRTLAAIAAAMLIAVPAFAADPVPVPSGSAPRS